MRQGWTSPGAVAMVCLLCLTVAAGCEPRHAGAERTTVTPRSPTTDTSPAAATGTASPAASGTLPAPDPEHISAPSAAPQASPTPGRKSTAAVGPGPRISRFQVSPQRAEPGDVVTLAWETHGGQAQICPSARYVLSTPADCRSVSASGQMRFTIPGEASGFGYVDFTLKVWGGSGDMDAVRTSTLSVGLICPTPWFFSDEMRAGVCPREAIESYAAAQRFQHGLMIWIEEMGRYAVLHEAPLPHDPTRKRVTLINDPLEIVRDTSSAVTPPEGLHAPVSGFGLVWRGDVSRSPGFREALGWALAPEFGYTTIYQCDDARPSGGRSWQMCTLQGPDGEVIVLHPLGGWYLPPDESAHKLQPPPQAIT